MLVDVILIVVVSPGTRSKAKDLFKIAIETEKKIFGTFLGDVPMCSIIHKELVTHGNVFNF